MDEERNLNIFGPNANVNIYNANLENSSVVELSMGTSSGGVDMPEAMRMDGVPQPQQVIPDDAPQNGPGENDGKVNEELAESTRTRKKQEETADRTGAGNSKKRKSSGPNYFKAFSLELRGEFDVADEQYEKAILKFEEIMGMKQWKPLKYYFTSFECNLMIGRTINKAMMKENTKNIQKWFSSVPPGIEDVVELVDIHIQKEKYLRALILLKWANDYGKFDKPARKDFNFENKFAPNDEMKPNCTSGATSNEHYNISQLIYKAYVIIREGISYIGSDKLKGIAKKYGVPLMSNMYKKMEEIQQVEPKQKVRKDAISCHLVGSVQSSLFMSDEAIESCEKSIKMLRGEYRFQTVGHALHVIGLAHKRLNHKDLAIENLEKAIEAKKAAKDFKDEGTRDRYIKNSRKLLNNARHE